MATIYDLAFANIHGIGPIMAKEIMNIFPSTEAIFAESKAALEIVFKGRKRIIDEIINKPMFDKCEKEIEFMKKYDINCFFFKEDSYPTRLKEIPDMPICLFYQGKGDLEAKRMVAIVGTRNASHYGIKFTEQIVHELRNLNVSIVSGLAYGIDTYAHTYALANEIPTFGVLGHGLDTIYPKENFDTAKEMRLSGGLVTEYFSGTTPFPANFPRRNRIIAGLCDAVIVIEAAKKGGALLTADLANQYNREVFSLPGRLDDIYSEGCNYLIRSQRANLIHNTKDIADIMNWRSDYKVKNEVPQKENKINNLPKDEQEIYDIIQTKKEVNIDDISIECSQSLSKLAGSLLSLELKNIICCLPGKVYKLC